MKQKNGDKMKHLPGMEGSEGAPAPYAPGREPEGGEASPEIVSIPELADDPDRFEGRPLKVKGYLFLSGESASIREKPDGGRTLQLDLTGSRRGSLLEIILLRLSHKRLGRVSGVFTRAPEGAESSLGVLHVISGDRAGAREEPPEGRSKTTKAIVIANLVPLLCVLFLRWDIGSLMVLYWAENLVHGLLSVLMILSRGGVRRLTPLSALARLAGAGVFSFFYFSCCGAHGIAVMALFKVGDWGAVLERTLGAERATATAPFLHLCLGVIGELWNTMGWMFVAPLLSLAVAQGVKLYSQQRRGIAGQSRTVGGPGASFLRIVVTHLAIVFGGILLVELKSPRLLLSVLILAKIAIELALQPRFSPLAFAPKPGAAPEKGS